MKKKYVVTLSDEERGALRAMIAAGKASARKLMHAQILLKAERRGQREWEDTRIAAALEVAVSTIKKVRQRLVEEGLEAALVPRPPRREYARKLDGKEEAHPIALACSTPPEGHGRWTLLCWRIGWCGWNTSIRCRCSRSACRSWLDTPPPAAPARGVPVPRRLACDRPAERSLPRLSSCSGSRS